LLPVAAVPLPCADVDSLVGLGSSELLDAAGELDTQDLGDMGFEGTNSKDLMGMMEDLVEVRVPRGGQVRRM
jgi:hypothetical protein